MSASTPSEVLTDRLSLRRPEPGDLDAMFAIFSDPRVWTHYPTLRHAEPAQTAAMLERWSSGWERHGIGCWIVRVRETGEVIGSGGCSMLGAEGDPADARGRVWNLGYRLSADHHGRGYATEVSWAALAAVAGAAPEVPVAAYLVEHNPASAAVAEKVGLRLVHRAPDAGNPDPAVMRLVFADRAPTSDQLATALR